MNQIKKDGQYRFLNLNEFRFPHQLSVNMPCISEYYNDSLTLQLCNRMAAVYGTNAENILPVNGGDAAIDLLTRLHSHMHAVIFAPTYGAYESYCKMYRVPYKESKVITDNSLVFICNPNNPTGDVLDTVTLATCNPTSVFVIDETYIDFTKTPSAIGNLPNVYVIRSMSKYYGLAGLRIACIVSTPDNINKIKPEFNNKHLLDVSKLYAIQALDNKAYYDACAVELAHNKSIITKALRDKKIEYIDTPCNFICVKGGVAELQLAERLMLKFRDLDARIKGMYRITVGNYSDTKATLKFISAL